MFYIQLYNLSGIFNVINMIPWWNFVFQNEKFGSEQLLGLTCNYKASLADFKQSHSTKSGGRVAVADRKKSVINCGHSILPKRPRVHCMHFARTNLYSLSTCHLYLKGCLQYLVSLFSCVSQILNSAGGVCFRMRFRAWARRDKLKN